MWSDNGHEITVLAGMIHGFESKKLPEYKGRFFVFKRQGKVSVWRCYMPDTYNSNFRLRLLGYLSFVFFSVMAGIFKTNSKYDLLLVSSPPLFTGITAYVLSVIKKIPYVFEIRDLWPESAIDTGVVKNRFIINMALRFERFIYKKASGINVLTPAFLDLLVNKKNVPGDKVVCIPNASDFRFSDEYLKKMDVRVLRESLNYNDKFVITYVGAHGIANHLIQLLDTADLLRNTNVLLVLIGDGMQKPMLVEEAVRRNLKNVVFLEPLPKGEIFKYIIASDMGVSVLKRLETFKTIYSNKTFDYMACKKPVLMIIDGISRDLIEKAECGVFAEPEKPDDIAEKILLCMRNPDMLLTMGENGYNYAKKHYDRSILANKYINYLHDIKNI
jgi:glycosyltransferase involved in cell wall biosynthesis